MEIKEEIEKMTETIETFSKDCTKLPASTKKYDAFRELKTEIDNMSEIIPLVDALAKPSIRPRHWEEIITMTNSEIPYESDTFTLAQLLQAPLLKHKDDIEDIADSADKQEKLEKQLNGDISAYWEDAELEIGNRKGVDAPCMLAGNIVDIQEKLDEHIVALNQMNAMRYVTPFRSIVQEKSTSLSEAADTIEKWLKVQTLWSNLVAVFAAGDIAKQMPTESKKFKQIDRLWLKIMERANENRNVIKQCGDDFLKNQLPTLKDGLDLCQRKLEDYLETKRSVFPRFYFCSDDVLLKILSVGSDPHAVQDDFENFFEAINKVSFDDTDRRLIIDIRAVMGSAEEVIPLQDPVKAEGNIEEWLCRLELEMKRSMRGICARGNRECHSMPLKEFIDNFPAQVALLGVQILWTFKVQEGLEKGKQGEKTAELKKNEGFINKIATELTGMCLEDMGPNKLRRTKVETIVTIHVHQKDVYLEIQDAVKAYRVRDANDFEWAKNTRCGWKQDTADIAVDITDIPFVYQYEFLGAKERLCITALTDRCYVTLSQALGMLYGGAPAGPAGTGKTETVKDLGRTLGIFVVVNNCSDEHKYKDMAKIFKGLCQSGLWGCFDEFNRISLATLSVVAS